jgi:hypothetical protein
MLVNPNPPCTKCLASLHVAYTIHGVDPVLLEEFLNSSIELHRNQVSEDCSMLEKVQKVSRMNTAMTLLSVLQRSKSFG